MSPDISMLTSGGADRLSTEAAEQAERSHTHALEAAVLDLGQYIASIASLPYMDETDSRARAVLRNHAPVIRRILDGQNIDAYREQFLPLALEVGAARIPRGHCIARTSPKGEKFVGTCTQCGKAGLAAANLKDHCPGKGGHKP